MKRIINWRQMKRLCLLSMFATASVSAEEWTTEFEVVGQESQWWNNYVIRVTNTGSTPMNLKGAELAFSSAIQTGTPNWSGTGVSYPTLVSESSSSGSGYTNSVTIQYADNSWTDTQLEPNNSIAFNYGISGQIGGTQVQNSLRFSLAGQNTGNIEVSIVSPSAGSQFETGETITVAADVVAENTSVQSVDFSVDGVVFASDNAAPYEGVWTAEGTGQRNIEVVAYGDNNLSSNDSVVISVADTPIPSISLVLNSPDGQSDYKVGDSVTLGASVTTENTDVDRVEFWVNNGIVGSDNTVPYAAIWTPSAAGDYVVKALAHATTDNLSDEQSVAVNVTEPLGPQAPQVSISGPQQVSIGQQLNLVAQVTDANNDVTVVDFYLNGELLNSDNSSPYNLTWTATEVGNVELQAIATDATNLTGSSNLLNVNVVEQNTGNLSCDISQIYRADGTECMGDDHPRRIIGYFTSWRTGKNGLPSYLAKDLPWDKLTHINYAFASINPQSFEIQVSAEATDIEWDGVAGAEMDTRFPYKGHFNHLSSLKTQYPDVKTLISVGGWAETTGFYGMTTDLNTCGLNQAGITTFNASAVEFIRQYGFDGVDVDYEYPSSMKDSGNPIDFAISNKCRGQLMDNYEVFMSQLRVALDEAGIADGRKYMLTIAAPSSGYLLRGMEDFALGDELDYVNIMTYDLHGAWNHFVGPQAALFDNGKDGELAAAGVYTTSQYQGIGYLNTAWAYQYFRGVFPPAKINIGIPYYTRGFQGVTGGTNGLWGKAALPSQSDCLPGTGANTPCGYGAEGIDNLWHDKDENGNEIPAGSMPMWHAMNLKDADTLNFGDMPSYGPDWGLDIQNPAHKVVGDYQYHYSEELGASWLWNPTKNVFISIEDEVSLAQKLDFIVEMGAGGMMVWEMAGDYEFNAAKGEYQTGSTLTNLAYNRFLTASDMSQEHNNRAAPEEVVDVSISTRDWPAGDSNYPVTPTLVIKNNGAVDIPAGTEITFLMTTSTGDVIKDWDGAGVSVSESGYTGSNFKLNGQRKDFHTVSMTLSASASIAAGTEHTVSMVYYLPVSGIASAVRFKVGDKVLGLKSEYPDLPEYAGGDNSGGGPGDPGDGNALCSEVNVAPENYNLYPDFPQVNWQGNPSHANQGDRMRHQNRVWQANWWTNKEPGSNGDWQQVCQYP